MALQMTVLALVVLSLSLVVIISNRLYLVWARVANRKKR
jgi:hypothetical protein